MKNKQDNESTNDNSTSFLWNVLKGFTALTAMSSMFGGVSARSNNTHSTTKEVAYSDANLLSQVRNTTPDLKMGGFTSNALVRLDTNNKLNKGSHVYLPEGDAKSDYEFLTLVPKISKIREQIISGKKYIDEKHILRNVPEDLQTLDKTFDDSDDLIGVRRKATYSLGHLSKEELVKLKFKIDTAKHHIANSKKHIQDVEKHESTNHNKIVVDAPDHHKHLADSLEKTSNAAKHIFDMVGYNDINLSRFMEERAIDQNQQEESMNLELESSRNHAEDSINARILEIVEDKKKLEQVKTNLSETRKMLEEKQDFEKKHEGKLNIDSDGGRARDLSTKVENISKDVDELGLKYSDGSISERKLIGIPGLSDGISAYNWYKDSKKLEEKYGTTEDEIITAVIENVPKITEGFLKKYGESCTTEFICAGVIQKVMSDLSPKMQKEYGLVNMIALNKGESEVNIKLSGVDDFKKISKYNLSLIKDEASIGKDFNNSHTMLLKLIKNCVVDARNSYVKENKVSKPDEAKTDIFIDEHFITSADELEDSQEYFKAIKETKKSYQDLINCIKIQDPKKYKKTIEELMEKHGELMKNLQLEETKISEIKKSASELQYIVDKEKVCVEIKGEKYVVKGYELSENRTSAFKGSNQYEIRDGKLYKSNRVVKKHVIITDKPTMFSRGDVVELNDSEEYKTSREKEEKIMQEMVQLKIDIRDNDEKIQLCQNSKEEALTPEITKTLAKYSSILLKESTYQDNYDELLKKGIDFTCDVKLTGDDLMSDIIVES